MFFLQSIYTFCTNYAEKQIKNMVTLWRKVVDDPFVAVCKIYCTIYAMWYFYTYFGTSIL